jgi:hypothetical protein
VSSSRLESIHLHGPKTEPLSIPPRMLPNSLALNQYPTIPDQAPKISSLVCKCRLTTLPSIASAIWENWSSVRSLGIVEVGAKYRHAPRVVCQYKLLVQLLSVLCFGRSFRMWQMDRLERRGKEDIMRDICYLNTHQPGGDLSNTNKSWRVITLAYWF